MRQLDLVSQAELAAWAGTPSPVLSVEGPGGRGATVQRLAGRVLAPTPSRLLVTVAG